MKKTPNTSVKLRYAAQRLVANCSESINMAMIFQVGTHSHQQIDANAKQEVYLANLF
jgi:hypothetical protein